MNNQVVKPNLQQSVAEVHRLQGEMLEALYEHDVERVARLLQQLYPAYEIAVSKCRE